VATSAYDEGICVHCVFTKLNRVYFQIWHNLNPITNLVRNWTPETFYHRMHRFFWIPLHIKIITDSPIPIHYLPTIMPDETHFRNADGFDTFRIWMRKNLLLKIEWVASSNIRRFLKSVPKRRHVRRLQRVHEMLLLKPPQSNFMGGLEYHSAMREFKASLKELSVP
jgi:hypothetical protein